jgi:putative transposase
MDQITHDIRRANWLTIITQCQERPAGVSAKQWLSDNGIREKSYYYWLRKFRKETYEQMQMPAVSQSTEVTFAEIPISAAASPAIVDHEPGTKPAAVIKRNGLTIEISNDISEGLLSRILREVTHA